MSDRLTPEREAEIREREAAATPGPWEAGEAGYIYDENAGDDSRPWIEPAAGTCPCVKAGSEVVASEILDEDRHGRPLTNAAFIAAARADVPALLAELDAMRAERDALREALSEACDEFEGASVYKGEYLARKHGDAETLARLRALLPAAIGGKREG